MKADQRDILALSFEPSNDGFIYYQYGWSSGVPVTADEREAYLAIPAFGSRRAWRRSIAGRIVLPPRSGKTVRMKLLAAMSQQMAIASLAFGVTGILVGIGSDSFLARALFIFGGILFFIHGISIIVARARQP